MVSLMAQKAAYVPTTFDELARDVKSGEFSCGAPNGEAITSFILESTFGNAKIFKEHIISTNNIFYIEEIYEKVMKGRFAFIQTDLFIGLIRKENDFSEVLISKDTLVTYTTAYGVRKGFPYKKYLDEM
ncbi:uncharacterized protein LOC111637409 [Centruroides sculpturatus]|uniref:uncharacterized protein LOC111637409 n=1 Tax=Centruroides sculpturatus TaxID=218467 RepID=UPI000C6CA5E0|nr:uncharacterized protein LOC111637409 [Centruroides sculpturatus]